ncbi:MAG: hypothetical protein AAGE59_28360 [Cyanobacteria bacterium P01_F01_bin.86]
MIIFISKSAFSISEQLRDSHTVGILGLCLGQDHRAVKQAAALAAAPVFVVNTFLLRLASALIVASIPAMLLSYFFTLLIEIAWVLMIMGLFAGFCCVSLDVLGVLRPCQR